MSKHKPYPQEHPHFIQGKEFERARIMVFVNNKLCFEHRNIGVCDHSACYEMVSLALLIKGENE